MPPTRDGLIVGVVGATGMVGRELLALLERRKFPVRELRPFSSGRTAASVIFHGRRISAPAVNAAALSSCDLAFLVSSDEVARTLAPRLAESGVWTIDDSAAFRMDPRVPLVIPEVNPGALRRDARLIAGPNCTMTGLAVAASRLHREIGVRAVRVASYQAVSGAGRSALEELLSQSRALAKTRPDPDGRAPRLPAGIGRALPRAIAFNAVPQVGRIGKDGCSGEENKVRDELRRVLSAPRLPVSATAVRVPTIRGHALAAWLTLARPLSRARALAVLRRTPGLSVQDGDEYPTPRSAGGTDIVGAARVRIGANPREIALWIVSDNLLKGAALNSTQIAEELLRRGWLPSR